MDQKSVLVADYKERFIWLDGHIESGIAYQFKRILAKMNRLKTTPLVFYIRGPGGDPFSAFLMMSEINNSTSPVATVAHGIVNSGCFTITQSGAYRLAMPGTKFTFHPTVGLFVRNSEDYVELNQTQLLESLTRFRNIDAIQLYWFFKKGRPIEKILDLFHAQTTIDVPKAKELGLIDCCYKKEDFLKDQRIARKLIKAKS